MEVMDFTFIGDFDTNIASHLVPDWIMVIALDYHKSSDNTLGAIVAQNIRDAGAKLGLFVDDNGTYELYLQKKGVSRRVVPSALAQAQFASL